MKLLIAEDTTDLNRVVTAMLQRFGYDVDSVFDGAAALDKIDQNGYDAVILDIMMPKMDGISVLRNMRDKGITTPVLLLTAKSEVDDRVAGLDAGADDYLPKPFATSELLARVRALLRRKVEYAPDVLRFADIELDRGGMLLRCGGQEERLSNKAFQLMEMLVERPSVVHSIDQIMERVWGWDSDAEVNVVWVNISFLRKKLKELGAHVEIKATRGVGYSLEAR